MYVCMYTYIYIYMCVCVCVCVSVYVCVYIYIYTYICVYVCVRVRMYVCMHANMHPNMCMTVMQKSMCMCLSIMSASIYLYQDQAFLMRVFSLFCTLVCSSVGEIFSTSLPKIEISYRQQVVHCYLKEQIPYGVYNKKKLPTKVMYVK